MKLKLEQLRQLIREQIRKSTMSEIYSMSAASWEESQGGGYSGNKAFLEQLLSNCEQNIKFYEDQLKNAKSKKMPKESIAVVKRNLDFHKDCKKDYEEQIKAC